MPIFGKKGKGLDSLNLDEVEALIVETKTEISLLQKESDRSHEKFNQLMSEGSKSSGSRRVQIARELDTLERRIKNNEHQIVERMNDMELLEQVKDSKKIRNQTGVTSVLSNTDSGKLKSQILQGKTKTKVNQNKRDELLNTVRDLDIDQDEQVDGQNKYMEMFREMDRHDTSLEPGRSKLEKRNQDISEENERKTQEGEE
jgi:hypothetical protein